MKQSVLVFLALLVLCLTPKLAIYSGQAMIDMKVLESGDGGQCSS